MATNGTEQAQITDLIAQAEAAHGQYEHTILRRPDPRWAEWLAGFVLDRSLQKWLPQPISEAQLARWFAEWDGEYAAAQVAEPRAEYFAGRLLDALKVVS